MTAATPPMSPESRETAEVPQASLIIPHYNDTQRLRRCLTALRAQKAHHKIEIVVADNNSTDEIAPIQAEFPEARFVVETEKGAASARNAGVAVSRGAWLFFLDSDCVPGEDWLDQAMAKAGREVIIGGRVDLFDETPKPRSGAEAFETVFAFPQRNYVTKKHFSVTANMLVTRAMFEHVGGFDGRVAEDYDWCLRARALSYGIEYHDDLVMTHPTRRGWAELVRKWRRMTNESYFFNGTQPKDRLKWGLRGMIVGASALPHLLIVARSPKLAGLRERLDCAGTLLRLRLARAGWMLRQAVFGDKRVV